MQYCFRSEVRRAGARVLSAGNPSVRRLDMARHCGPKRPFQAGLRAPADGVSLSECLGRV